MLKDNPVTFPPGRARLAISRSPTGSPTAIITMGIVSVAFFLTCCRSWGRVRYEDVHLEPDQLGREVGQPVELTVRKSILDDDIPILDPPEFAQPLPERVEAEIGRRPRPEVAYPGHLSRRLRVDGEGHGEDTEGANDERPSLHYSIT